ncbi:Protein of unknown function [Halomonas shengliensis]|uniref:DUF2591 domain-containing protein n=1 Tax=Halomonas shengliensis TaxID=419597 RepID=A0A1H0LS95_9GAMM|nr:phage protein NinX family protein [Halomonas shengliensis]SDO70975.1 Protein of unknown function [Halomonas shengliensis]
MRVRELEGAALDWAVAQVTGIELDIIGMPNGAQHIGLKGRTSDGWPDVYSPSTDWSQGGPLIEQHLIELHTHTGQQYGEHERWYAVCPVSATGARCSLGPTPLVAAMRALVFAKLGAEIDLPEGLK